MAEGCGALLLLGLIATHRWAGSLVLAIPEKRDDESLRREYPLEEFLWTGSGDGPGEAGGEEPVAWLTTTVFRTTTRLLALPASVSLAWPPDTHTSGGCAGQQPECSLQPSQTWDADLSTPQFTVQLEPSEPSFSPPVSSKRPGQFSATPSLFTPVLSTASPVPPSDRPPDDLGTPDQRFWIVTVVEEQGSDTLAPDTPVLEVGLARLYATAFKRQQERHLGIVNATQGKLNSALVVTRRRRGDASVLVRVHNVTEGSPRRVKLVYSVHVSGRPVLARAAVHDMRLVSDVEVARELGGLAVVTKAEPYLKDPVESTHDAFTASPWVLAAGAISAVALLSLVICLLLLATTRHKRARRIAGQHAGATNLSYEPDDPRPALSEQGSVSVGSATKILPSDDGDWELDSEAIGDDPPPPSADVAAAAVAAAVAAARQSVSSPTSYLSMPSVRRFPRGGNIPEPLSQLLGGAGESKGRLSVRNLDLYPDETAFEPVPPGVPTPPPPRPTPPPGFYGARHGSLDGEDPGVVGPCVYQMARGAGPARRRFQELLDDAFSLFGGRSEDEEERRTPTPPRPPSPRVDSRVHSAAQARVSEPDSPPPVRPKTSEPRRAAMQQPRRGRPPVPETTRSGSAGPRGAWETPCESATGMRPLSAGPFHRPRLPESARTPRVSTERILADSELPAGDPAVPLISAIKDELQRFQACSTCTTPLPGCTSQQQQQQPHK